MGDVLLDPAGADERLRKILTKWNRGRAMIHLRLDWIRQTAVIALVIAFGLGWFELGVRADENYTGNYKVTLGAEARWLLNLTQTGSTMSWRLRSKGITVSGSGNVSGSTATLTSDGPLRVALTLRFTGSGAFEGTWSVKDEEEDFGGSVTGSTAAPPSYNVNVLGIPRFVNQDYIELSKINRISLFRSSAGHDYSDDREKCRSMKHYYDPKPSVNSGKIKVTSPVDGVVLGYVDEFAGTQLGIASSQNPGIHFILFHVKLKSRMRVGDVVAAGQVLGTHFGPQAVSDIAVAIVTPKEYRLVSFLDVMSDSLFASYQARGVNTRTDAILLSSERNSDPLTCRDEEFATTGSLPAWIQLR